MARLARRPDPADEPTAEPAPADGKGTLDTLILALARAVSRQDPARATGPGKDRAG